MDENERLTQVFFDVQAGLPRQGPGAEASTLRALAACADLPASPDVLDIGCGPGMQTLALANALDGQITAVDFYPVFLEQLTASAEAAGVAGKLTVQHGDMADLPFAPGSFDLIWSEGAAYIMGFGKAMAAWRPLLKPGGYIAVTELVWLQPDPPEEVRNFWKEEYPDIRGIEASLAKVRAAGYTVVDHFTLPNSAWWDHYYGPLSEKLPGLREKYAGDEAALGVIAMTATEIDMRRKYGDWYSYAFFIGRNPA